MVHYRASSRSPTFRPMAQYEISGTDMAYGSTRSRAGGQYRAATQYCSCPSIDWYAIIVPCDAHASRQCHDDVRY
eukprot:1267165-Rhodomonas_salina.1